MERKEAERACRRLRRLGWFALALWLGWIPVGICCIVLSQEASTPALRTAPLVVIGLHGTLFLLTGLAIALWRCPRCGAVFEDWWELRPWKRWKACSSCGVAFKELCPSGTRRADGAGHSDEPSVGG